MKFDATTPSASGNGTQYDQNPICRVAPTSNTTISSPGATLDGVTMVAGDRVLLYSQSTGSQNGYYIFNGSGSAMTRAPNITYGGGMRSVISEGTKNNNQVFQLTNDTAIIVDTTALVFVRDRKRQIDYLLSISGVQ